MITYDEMVAAVDQMIHEACEEEGVDYDHFINALNASFSARFEIVEM